MEMTAPILYITGTNTEVGKTTLASLLLRRARERNIKVAAIKPFCSGSREDAERLHALQSAGLALDEVNPFYFRQPISPYVAANNENRTVTMSQTIDALLKIRARGCPTLLEGAGGLMSPLGANFTLLDLIQQLPGKVCAVGQNRLGVINAALLTHRPLKSIDLRFILMSVTQPDASAASNAAVIREWTRTSTSEFPFLPNIENSKAATPILDELLGWWISST
jgi:dethiobiotin synthetase